MLLDKNFVNPSPLHKGVPICLISLVACQIGSESVLKTTCCVCGPIAKTTTMVSGIWYQAWQAFLDDLIVGNLDWLAGNCSLKASIDAVQS